LNESQRAVVGARISNLEQGDNQHTPIGVTSQKKASELLNVGIRQIQRAKEVMRKAPQEIEEVMKGTKTLGAITREIHIKEDKEQVEQEVKQKEVEGVFDVIVIDPPWNYGNDDKYDEDNFRGTCNYSVMDVEDIKAIQLPSADDCVLWLWTTNTFMHEAFHCLEEWGFEPKTILTWDKQFLGIGRWLRSITEHCILATKGNPLKKGLIYNKNKYSTLLFEKRTTHSTKPETFYKMVEEICEGRKLDYFARKKREGWDVYGDEVSK